jgi:hypothetical protein
LVESSVLAPDSRESTVTRDFGALLVDPHPWVRMPIMSFTIGDMENQRA